MLRIPMILLLMMMIVIIVFHHVMGHIIGYDHFGSGAGWYHKEEIISAHHPDNDTEE